MKPFIFSKRERPVELAALTDLELDALTDVGPNAIAGGMPPAPGTIERLPNGTITWYEVPGGAGARMDD